MNRLSESGLRTLAEELAESWISGNRNDVVSEIFSHPQRAGLAALTVLAIEDLGLGSEGAGILAARLVRLECA